MSFEKLYTQLREAGHASDFPIELGNTLHRVLLDSYRGVNSTWRLWCYLNKNIKDFKENTRFQLTDVDDLLETPWGQPAKETTYDEHNATKYILATFTRAFGIPWQLLRNDDVGAIRQIPQKLGRAGGRTIARFVVALLEGVSASNTIDSELSENALGAAITEFKNRRDPRSGEKIGVSPKFLIVPADIETTAKRIQNSQITISVGGGSTPATIGHYNPVNANETHLQLVVEPFLNSSKNWFLAADPSDTPGIELGFLDGKDQPQIYTKASDIQGLASVFERGSFDTGSIDYKIEYIFGGTVIDPNALLKVNAD